MAGGGNYPCIHTDLNLALYKLPEGEESIKETSWCAGLGIVCIAENKKDGNFSLLQYSPPGYITLDKNLPEGPEHLSCSRDGKACAISYRRDTEYSLAIYHIPDSTWEYPDVTLPKEGFQCIDWSPDSQQLIYNYDNNIYLYDRGTNSHSEVAIGAIGAFYSSDELLIYDNKVFLLNLKTGEKRDFGFLDYVSEIRCGPELCLLATWDGHGNPMNKFGFYITALDVRQGRHWHLADNSGPISIIWDSSGIEGLANVTPYFQREKGFFD